MSASRRNVPRTLPALLLCLCVLSAPAWAANIRFIVFSSSLNAGDLAMRNLMQSFGHAVTVKSAHSSSAAADTAGQDLIVISSSVGTVEVNTKFRDVTKPVITLKYALFDEMGLVSTAADQAGGFAGGQTAIQNAGHFLAAGYAGTVQVFSPDDNLNWGVPTAGALRIASLTGNANRSTIFAYETGAAMVGLSAPGRRLAFFFRDNGATRSTAQGQALFRAAIDWSLGLDGPQPAAPVITSAPASATVPSPDSVTFSVTATAYPPITGYQWQRNGINIAGATSATYVREANSADDSTGYRVAVTNAMGTTFSSVALLRVLYRPIWVTPSMGVSASGFAGETRVIEFRALGNPPPTYTFTSTDPAFTGPDSLGRYITAHIPNAPAGATYSYRAVASNSRGESIRETQVLSNGYEFTPPVFLQHPTDDSTTAGFPARFEVFAEGRPAPTYRWQRNGMDIPGATGVVYSFTATPADDGALFRAIATNSQGSVTSTSAPAIVRHAPVITKQPSDVQAGPGATATFSVSASGRPSPAFQWKRNGVDIPGAVSTSMTTSLLAPADDGAAYTVAVSNALGSVTSAPALVRIHQAPTLGSLPDSVIVLLGQGATLSIEVGGIPAPSLQWRRNGVDIPGAVGSAYQIPAVTMLDHHARFSVAAVNSAGSSVSGECRLAVHFAPIVLEAPQPLTADENSFVTFAVTAHANPPITNYLWQVNGMTDYSATGQSWTFRTLNYHDSTRIRVIMTNSAGTTISESALLRVRHVPEIAPGSAQLRQGLSGDSVVFGGAVIAHPAPSISWSVTATHGPIPAFSPPQILDRVFDLRVPVPSGPVGAAFTYRLTASNEMGARTGTFTVTCAGFKEGPPVIFSQPAGAAVTAGQNAEFSIGVDDGLPGPLDIQWRRDDVDIPGATGSTYAIASASPADNGSSFTVVATNSLGSVTSEPATLSVQYAPIITAPPISGNVHVSQSHAFGVEAHANPAATYQWRRDGIVIPGATGPLLQTLPATAGDDGAVYSVTVTNAIGSAEASAVLGVLQAPIVTEGPASLTLDEGASSTFAVSVRANPPVTGYQWQQNGVDIPGATSSSYTRSGISAWDDSATFRVRVTNALGSIISNSALLRVRHAPVLRNADGGSMFPSVLLHGKAGDTVSFSFSMPANPAATYIWTAGIPGPPPGLTPPAPTGDRFNLSLPVLMAPMGTSYSHRLRATNEMGFLEMTIKVTTSGYNVGLPYVYLHPANDTALAGQAAAFTTQVIAGTSTNQYQWFRNGVAIPGANSMQYHFTAAIEDNGAAHRLRASNSYGEVFSQDAYLAVHYAPAITQQPPAEKTGNAGMPTVFQVQATGNPAPAYQWSKDGAPIPGATSANYFTPPLLLSDDGSSFAVTVTNAHGSVTSTASILRVQPALAAPAITSQPADLFLYPGENAVFRVGYTGYPAPTVSWTVTSPTFEPGPFAGDSLWLGPVELADHGTRVRARVQNQQGFVMTREAILNVHQRPTRHLVSLTGELFAADNLSPIGYTHTAVADVTVKIYSQAEGGGAVYTEEFLRTEGRTVVVDRGLFTVRLGQGRTTQVLSEVTARHSNLYAELTVQVQGMLSETLQPRIPITSPMVAGTPRILQGTVDPTTASEPVGTYYENTATGATWLRMPATWVRIAQ